MFGYKLPDDFLIGTANAAFQSEGAWDRDGKSESNMDRVEKEYQGKVMHLPKRDYAFSEDMADRGCFFYDNFEAYIEDMKKTGQNTYRMSLAWPRIIPDGIGKVNPKGIDFYNKVIDKLISCGITPFVDIWHWDLPQCLDDMGGFLSPQFPSWYENYARVCFENFGDRVKLWSTFNEATVAVFEGYGGDAFPPFTDDGKAGELACHHLILAHFKAVKLYKSMNLDGKIGCVHNVRWYQPARMCREDIDAAAYRIEHRLDWFAEPMFHGHYPEKILAECPKIAADMPENYAQEIADNFVPMDFIGINYYTTFRTVYDPERRSLSRVIRGFHAAEGQKFAPYPNGLIDVINYVRERYGNPEMYITENGCAHEMSDDPKIECNDDDRIAYIREHLRNISRLISTGANLKGYYYWNDADSYEWRIGYELRFGLTFVDHDSGKRTWKKSRYYFSEICKNHMVD